MLSNVLLPSTGYSLITNPWMAMPFEALESFTNSLLTVTSISYAGTLSNPSTVASMQGLLGGTYHGVGKLKIFYFINRLKRCISSLFIFGD